MNKQIKPLDDMPPSVRNHGRNLLAEIEQSIRSAYLKGVADGQMEMIQCTLEEAANQCERWYYDLDEPASYLQCANSIRNLAKKLT